MADKVLNKHESRDKRKRRVRKSVVGTAVRPRLCVYKSNKFTYAQIICDDTRTIITGAKSDTIDGSAKGKAAAKALGQKIAAAAIAKDVKSVVFDRNGYSYHGRVAAVAEGARDAGLEF